MAYQSIVVTLLLSVLMGYSVVAIPAVPDGLLCGRKCDNDEDQVKRDLVECGGGKLEYAKSQDYSNFICYLEVKWNDGKTISCTGFYQKSRSRRNWAIVTAGHCLYNADIGTMADKVTIWPGRNGNIRPVSAKTKNQADLRVHPKYMEASTRGSQVYDVGVIRMGYWPIRHGFETQVIPAYLLGKGKMNIRIAGYPDSKHAATFWESTGVVSDVTNGERRLQYSLDTERGMSGSPVLTFYPNGGIARVIGVHSGSSPGRVCPNYAVRITRSVSDLIDAWARNVNVDELR